MRFVGSPTILLAVGVLIHAGCASHRAPSPADRFILHKNVEPAEQKPEAPPSPSLEEAIGKIRHLMATARPEPKNAPPTLEQTDPVLAAALSALSKAMSDPNLSEVGAAYHRRGLIDQAYRYYNRALGLNPRHAPSMKPSREHGVTGECRNWAWATPIAPFTTRRHRHPLEIRSVRCSTRSDNDRMRARLTGWRSCWIATLHTRSITFAISRSSKATRRSDQRMSIGAATRPGARAAHNNLALTYAAIGRLDLARKELAKPAARQMPRTTWESS